MEKKIECNELLPWYPSCAGYEWGNPFLSSSTCISEEGTPSTARKREEKWKKLVENIEGH